MKNSAVVLLSLIFLFACRSDERSGGGDGPHTLNVDSVPILQIAGTGPSGELVFGSAAGGTVLSDGRIVIADGLEHSVRFFNEAGELELTVGRKGQGPGEFEYIGWLGQCGIDSVFVWDGDLNRMTVIDAAGHVVTTYRVPDDPSVVSAAVINCSRHGALAAIASPANVVSTTEHYSAPLWLVNTRGAITHSSFGNVPAFEGRPLGKVSSIAVSGDRVYVGTKDSLYVDAYDHDGHILAPVLVADSFRVPTSHHYDLAIDVQVSRLGSVDDRRFMKELMLRRPMPEFLPPYADLFIDPAGTLWVQLSLIGDPETWLRAFDAAGKIISNVRLPRYVKVFEIGDDYILGTYDDDMGEPYVALFPLR